MPGTDDRRADDTGDDESRQERINRELIELLNELRVALPGVQFLFAFLLIVPFQQSFAKATDFQRGVYFVALAAAVVATALLIAPAAQEQLDTLQWVIPALTGALVALSSYAGEQQRPSEVARGASAR